MSYRQPLTQWGIDDLDVAADEARAGNSYYEVAELSIPEKRLAVSSLPARRWTIELRCWPGASSRLRARCKYTARPASSLRKSNTRTYTYERRRHLSICTSRFR